MEDASFAAWEYKALRLPMPISDDMETALERRLNEAGEVGWEMVGVTSAYVQGQPPMLHAYFKRRMR